MGKIKVSGKILIDDRDIDLWGEPAKPDDKRSNINFNLSNKDLEITNADYNKHYVTVYNSASRSKADDIPDSNFQKPHSLYLGHLSNKHIWLVERGCRPQLNDLSGIQSAPGEYTFALVDGKTRITSTNVLTAFGTSKKSIDIDAVIFYITFVAGGGNGCQGYAQVNNWALFGLASSEWYTGCGGGSGASATVLVDMSKIPGNSFKLNIGAATEESSISVGSASYVRLFGGSSGGKCKSGKNTNWGNASNGSKNSNSNAGSGGTYSKFDVNGLTVISIANGAKGTEGVSMKSKEVCAEEQKELTYSGKGGSNGYGNGGAGSIFGDGGSSPNSYDASAGNGACGAGGGGGTVPDASWWWNASGSCAGGAGGTGAFKLYY